ncbi:FxSxx-COOH system tetratricopeptide repeat protein [Rhodococcus koreensis]
MWWIDAEQPASIPRPVHRARLSPGPARGIARPRFGDRGAARACRGERWLLVFDNAEDPRSLRPYWPTTPTGRVLVTSRHPGWGGIGGRLEVAVFTRAESLALLARQVPGIDDETADKLAGELGDLRLALEQAAGYMEVNGTDPQRYLELFRVMREELLAEGDGADHVLLDATWQISLTQLAEDDPAAVQLLHRAAFLAPEPLPMALFDRAGEEPEQALLPEPLGSTLANPALRDKLLGRLHRYALARRDGDVVVLHRRVQAAIRRSLPPVDLDTVEESVLRLLRAAVAGDLGTPENWRVWREVLPHVLAAVGERAERAQPDTTAWLLDRAGIYLRTRGEPGRARPLLERVLTITETAYGPDHPEVAVRLSNLARVWKDLGDPGRARPLLERALTITETAYGPDHLVVAVMLGNLALVWRDLGDRGRARPLFERALTITETARGPDHPQVAVMLSNLATVLGDPGRARPLLERALTIAETSRGPDHPEVATDLSNLAMVWRDLGDLGRARARPLLERALTITETARGPDHPTVAVMLGNLALVWRDLGKPARARPLLERALTIAETGHGPNHPTVAIMLSNLALVWRDLGDPARARPLFERALRITEAAYGPNHPTVALIRHGLENLD